MLSRIIRRPDYLAKYREVLGPAHVDDFVVLLLGRGYARASIKWVLYDAKEFVEWGAARALPIRALDDAALARFDRRNLRRARHSRKALVRRLTNADSRTSVHASPGFVNGQCWERAI